jgi:hypothetical protein
MGGGGFYYSSSDLNEAQADETRQENKEKKKVYAKDEGEYVDFEEIK